MSHDAAGHCHCSTRHVPKPNELHSHHVWPLGEGGPDIKSNLLWLCPTMHANVHELWRLYKKHKGRPPWIIEREYSHYCRTVVSQGWAQKMAAANSGGVEGRAADSGTA